MIFADGRDSGYDGKIATLEGPSGVSTMKCAVQVAGAKFEIF